MIDLDEIQCLADIPAAQSRARGDATAIRFNGVETSFAELDRRSDVVARAMLANGIGVGDRIAVLTRNHGDWYELFFGTARARGCFAPINCRLSAGEIAFILKDAAPTMLFVGENLFDVALEATTELPAMPRLVALNGTHPQFESFAAWQGSAHTGAPVDPPALDDDVLQLYTSGTTGRPKGVVLTNRNYRRFLEMSTEIDGFAYEPGETVLMVMPLFHVAGINVSFSALAQGCRLLLVRDFTADDAVTQMQEERVAHVFLAPAMILMMLQSDAIRDASFGALRTIAYGAAPVAQDVLSRAKIAFGCGFVQFYGMTESAGGGCYLSPSDHDLPGLLRSCGKPWPNLEVAIVDSDDTQLGPDEIGEIVIRGDLVMKEYWNRPEATAETLAGGWLHTGDAGYSDAAGYLYVHDRIKDVIISGGENIYPVEIENAITGCPGVGDVAVIGVPDPKWGEVARALIVADGTPPEYDAVIAWVRARIAAYKAPKHIEIVEALPRNAAGKILRRELRKPYWQGRDRTVG